MYAAIRDITPERATIISIAEDADDFCYDRCDDVVVVALNPEYDYEDGERIRLLRDVVGSVRLLDGSCSAPSVRR